MKISGVAKQFTPIHLNLLKQIGVEVLRAFRENNYQGFIRVDHVPLLATELGEYDGYGMHGHVFATGYLKGLMEPIFGKPNAT
jgi:D-mannonate dehydratase